MPRSRAATSILARSLPLALAALLTSLSPAAAQGYGRVQGRVTATDTDRGLEGARVSLRRSILTAVTDASGRYVFPRVPAGIDTLEVAYLGRRRELREGLVVGPGATVEVDVAMAPAPVVLTELKVLGSRAFTQAEALSRQQAASNIVSIVASDQIGRFPDPSAPDAVQRLPGVGIERDQGEGRYITIRGASAQNTLVTFNGEQIPAPEPDLRQIALDAVPVDVLESIEVAKTITANMDADAIGGAVNLVTKTAPDRRFFSLEGAGGYAPLREDVSGDGSLAYGTRLADGRMGLMFSGAYSQRSFGSDDAEPDYDLGDPGLGDDALTELQVRHYSLWRERIGGTGAFDWRLGENSRLSLTGIYTDLGDREQRRRLDSALEDGELLFVHKNRLERQKTWNLTFGGDHLLSSGVDVDYHLTLTRSIQDTPYDNEVFFLQEDVGFSPELSDKENIRSNPDAGTVGGTFLFDAFEPASSYSSNLDRVAALNLTFPYRLGGSATGRFKVGAKYRDKNKWQEFTALEAGLADGEDDIVLGDGVGAEFPVDEFEAGDYQLPPFATTEQEVRGFGERFGAALDSEVNLEESTNNFDLSERVVAAYAMTEIQVTPRLMLLPGLRYEHTSFDGNGIAFDPEAETLTPQRGENDYGRLFPSLNLRYELGSRSNLRAAVTTAIARPNFIDLAPYRIADGEDLALGNPELDPTTSTNLDLLLEHYDQRIGVLSAGLFYKRLKDPIFLFVEDNDLGGETEQPRNGDKGRILGVELAVQQRLQMLPPPFDGLGFFGNYTYTDSETSLPGGRDVRLQGQAPHVFNTALSYERGRFSGQVSFNFQGNYVLEYGGDTGAPEEALEDLIVDDHLQLDVSTSLGITRTTTAFLELVNLTNEPYITYLGLEERPRQREFYRSWGRFGFRFVP